MSESEDPRQNRSRPGSSKAASRLTVTFVYLLALVAAAAAVRSWPTGNVLVQAAAGDLAATLVVFAFSMLLNNSSVYDPYWSVAPIVISAYWWIAIGPASGPALVRALLVMILILVWGGRLTGNWLRRWQGLHHEDWRYASFRGDAHAVYALVSLFGFHLMPTVLVFLGCIPVFAVFASPGTPLGLPDLAGLVVTAGAVWIEARADRELDRFKRTSDRGDETLRSGLWSLSRHPNYFGEVLFWWGLLLFGLAAGPAPFWMVAGMLAGPVGITLLFMGISVPMMDRHMEDRYPHYSITDDSRGRLLPKLRK